MSADAGMRLFENPHVGEPHSYEGKGKLAAWTEGIKAIIDSLGLCYFIYGWYDVSFGSPDELAELLNLATGMHLSGKELHWRGLRTHTLERLLSYRLAGFSRKDDYMPERFFNTSVSSGPYQGAHLEHEPVEAMLDEYYKTLDWEVETGLPGASAIQRYRLRELFD
jgi:aldehyde:ferredoxin oxidoreductase